MLPLVSLLRQPLFFTPAPEASVLVTLSSFFGTSSAPSLSLSRLLNSFSSMRSASSPNSSLITVEISITLLRSPGLLPLLYILLPLQTSNHMPTIMHDQMKLNIDTMKRNMYEKPH